MMKYKRLIILATVIISAALLYTFYFKNDKSVATGEDAKASHLAEIQKVMVIPSEDPTYFVIDNAELLSKQQLFFQNAVNGDALFVFQNSGKAIIWSPSRSKVINSGPIEYSATSTASTTTTKKN